MTEKQTVKFGDICREVKLTTKNPIADGYDKYIGLEHLDSGSLKIKRWGSIAEDNPSFTRVFKKGQILFGKRRPYLKKAGIAEFDGICSGDIIVMEPKDDLMLPKLLPFLVQSEKFWDWAIKTSSGSLSPRTKFKALSVLEIANPKGIEQTKISRFIDKSTEFLHDIELNKIGLSENSFQIIRSFLRYGLYRKKDFVLTKDFASLPTGWKLKVLDNVAKINGQAIRTGPFGSALKGEHWTAVGRPVITIGCLGEYGYESKDELYIDENYALTLDAYQVNQGDIVFSRVADIGRSIIVNSELDGAIISSNLMKISLNKELVLLC